MRKSKLDHPPIKQEVVKRLAVGERPKSIAKDVGLSHSQVYRYSRREDIKALIEQEQRSLVEVVPDAVENVKSLVREMKDIPKKDTKRRELSQGKPGHFESSRDYAEPSPIPIHY